MTNFPYKAMILDMDGVVTNTREMHFDAWKISIDQFLSEHGDKTLFEKKDYAKYVDGKTREEGIFSFMQSRKINLSSESIKALGIKKNQLYLKKLREIGPEVFEDSVKAIKSWKDQGIPVAIISSSRNCSEVLEKAGIKNLFDAQIDSVTAEKSHLKSKPEADYFVEAARLLGESPEDCAIVEDSLAGIKAGNEAHFKGVIGMSRKGQTPASLLYAEGATLVVDSLGEITNAQNAIEDWHSIRQKIGEREVALFIDYDGTLSKIVSDPSKAEASPALLAILKECSLSLKIAIVSGRDRLDVKQRVNLENIFYAGCHGFDISGPGGFHFIVEEALPILPEILAARQLLEGFKKDFSGILIEDKKFFIAVHYRNVSEEDQTKVKEKVREVANRFENLAIREGKKVIELAPKLDWDKGSAIRKLSTVLEINPEQTVSIYLGDDLTDEDAFREINVTNGIGIKIDQGQQKNTAADYLLKDPLEVKEFLNLIKKHYTGSHKRWRAGV